MIALYEPDASIFRMPQRFPAGILNGCTTASCSYPPVQACQPHVSYLSLTNWTTYQAAKRVRITKTAVTTPAPTRSAVVTPSGAPPGCFSSSLPSPAVTSPLDVPPVSLDSGPSTRLMRLLWMVSRADICSPTPYSPSHPFTHHLCPQVTPFSPPEQDCAAAIALDCRYGSTISYVHGATLVVAAIQRARYALKLLWSTSHIPFRSHAASNMIRSSVKKALDPPRRPSTRFRHVAWASPSVCKLSDHAVAN